MFNMFKAIFHLFRSVILFVEVAFISYVVGSSIQSTSFMVISFAVLCGLLFWSATLSISIAWVVLGFSMFHFYMGQNILTSAVAAVIMGLLRLVVWRLMAYIKK
ncbi:hypothetical protein CLV36_107167 [Laceyella sediminis]|uniref:Uncharacterized protein n=1 Tax=Laceyella sediminis TaxID=573074 RepID=A0ABX5ENE1_9BACL|nr:hypothetical protein [Laceyella sediminis]PRZ13972.1 hypothetical protein CLV36_107167 [Laceyella sediminis]